MEGDTLMEEKGERLEQWGHEWVEKKVHGLHFGYRRKRIMSGGVCFNFKLNTCILYQKHIQ
jgi:hypothetical protein